MAVTVPVEPTVQRQGIQTGRLSRVSPGTGTQAARQLQQVGQTLTQQGGELSQIAVQQQQDRNTSQVLAAKTAFDAQAAERLTDARNAQGANAWGVTKRTEEWWQKATSEHIDNMENEAQKQTLRRMFDEKWPSTKANIYSHEVGQQRKAVNDSAKASIQSASDLAVANHNDPNLVNQAITDITRTVKVQQATNEGWTPDVAEAARMSHLTALHKSVIDAKLDENPAAAEAYYEKHKDQIRGSDQPLVEEGLATGKRRRQSQEFADQIAIEDKSEEEAIAEARKRFEGEDEEEAIGEVTRRFSRREAAISRAQAQALRDVNKIILDEGGGYLAVPNTLLAKLPAAKRTEIGDPSYGQITDYSVYYGLRSLAGSADPKDRQAFAALNLEDYFGKLDPSTRKEMIKLQTEAKKSVQGATQGSTTWQIMQRAAAQANHDTSLVNKPGGDTVEGRKADRLRAFYNKADSILSGMPGASRTDVQKVMDGLVAEENQLAWDNNWWNTQERLSDIDIKGVPGDKVIEYANLILQEGGIVSDDLIRELYEEDKRRGNQ